MFIFLILSLFFSAKDEKLASFTFMTSQNREYTLKKQENNFWKRNNILKRITRKILGGEDKKESTSGRWYYVHFLEDDHQEFQRKLKIKTESGLLKKTYVLYLTEEELLSIENVTLVHEISPSEKFQESGGKLSDTKYFHVITTSKSNIPNISENYAIERQETEDMYIIRVDRSTETDNEYLNKKKRAIKELSEIPTVKTISTFTRFTVKNAVMAGYTQKNSPVNQVLKTADDILYLPRNLNNLRGSGQIVTIQDTPIDPYHKMFHDPSYNIQFNTPLSNHRKLVYYGSKSSSLSLELNEHGTHVAGTVAGNADSCGTNANYFNGVAPDAKILYAGGLNDVTSSNLGSLMRTYGSYISTNSWGVNGYSDTVNYDYGKLANDNPDRIFLFAAGNEYSDGNFTVCDPGGSKNVLTIGAIGDFYNNVKTYSISSGSLSIKVRALLDADPWLTGSIGTSTSNDIVLIDGTRGDQCSTINSGKISLLYSSQTSSIDWVFKCQLSSTTGILYYQGSNPGLSGQVTLSDTTPYNSSAVITHADYSSGGPGNKGILKPDVVTPGTRIISAKSNPRSSSLSNYGCNPKSGGYTYMQGTSMATPNAAGATALVREYFKSKWSGGYVDLDGATLRALMINSAKHPSGSKTPDVLFGHGVVDLSTILPTDNSFGVQITHPNSLPSIGPNSNLVAKLQVNSNSKPLQITLSYLDPMLDANSPVPLTHDLDLFVFSPGGVMYKGDHTTDDNQRFSANEKVIINTNEIQTGEYSIYVVTDDFPDGSSSQKFSIAASGPITNGFISFTTAVTCPCAQCMASDPSRCQCDSSSIGRFCQAKIQNIDGTKGDFEVPPMTVHRVFFNVGKNIKYMKAKGTNAGKCARIWYSAECHVSLGNYDNSGDVGSLMNKETSVDPAKDKVCLAIANSNYRSASFSIELSEKSSKTGMIVGIVIGVIALVAIGVAAYCCYKKGKCSFLPCKLPVGN